MKDRYHLLSDSGEKRIPHGIHKGKNLRHFAYHPSGPELGYNSGKNHAWCLHRPCSLMGMLSFNQRFIKDINNNKKKNVELQLTRM